jgi:hypothetical protein
MSRGQVLALALLLLSTPAFAVTSQHKRWVKKPVKKATATTAATTPAGAAPTAPIAPVALSEEDKIKATQRAKQTLERQLQEASIKAQQAQARHADEMLKLQHEQERQTLEVARLEETKVREADEADRVKRDNVRKAHQREMQELQKAADIAAVQSKSDTRSSEKKVDPAELEFIKAHADAIKTAFDGPRKITDRDSLPEITFKPAAAGKALSQPFVIRNANGEQRKQAQTFQQSWQARLLPIPEDQAPSNRAEVQNKQLLAYLNNYQAFVNHQAVTITKKNTFIREVPPTQYPAWYERTPGWTYCNGIVIGGSIQAGSDWFASEWPAIYGHPPAGFICQPDFIPTPWTYVPYNDSWKQAAVLTAGDGPATSYTGPITVEAIESMQAKVPDQSGVLVSQTINILYFYNAFYYPEFERWGYKNKQGFFVWLNI